MCSLLRPARPMRTPTAEAPACEAASGRAVGPGPSPDVSPPAPTLGAGSGRVGGSQPQRGGDGHRGVLLLWPQQLRPAGHGQREEGQGGGGHGAHAAAGAGRAGRPASAAAPPPPAPPLLLLLCGWLVVWLSCVLPKRLSWWPWSPCSCCWPRLLMPHQGRRSPQCDIGSPRQWASCRCNRKQADCWSACVLGHVHP